MLCSLFALLAAVGPVQDRAVPAGRAVTVSPIEGLTPMVPASEHLGPWPGACLGLSLPMGTGSDGAGPAVVAVGVVRPGGDLARDLGLFAGDTDGGLTPVEMSEPGFHFSHAPPLVLWSRIGERVRIGGPDMLAESRSDGRWDASAESRAGWWTAGGDAWSVPQSAQSLAVRGLLQGSAFVDVVPTPEGLILVGVGFSGYGEELGSQAVMLDGDGAWRHVEVPGGALAMDFTVDGELAGAPVACSLAVFAPGRFTELNPTFAMSSTAGIEIQGGEIRVLEGGSEAPESHPSIRVRSSGVESERLWPMIGVPGPSFARWAPGAAGPRLSIARVEAGSVVESSPLLLPPGAEPSYVRGLCDWDSDGVRDFAVVFTLPRTGSLAWLKSRKASLLILSGADGSALGACELPSTPDELVLGYRSGSAPRVLVGMPAFGSGEWRSRGAVLSFDAPGG